MPTVADPPPTAACRLKPPLAPILRPATRRNWHPGRVAPKVRAINREDDKDGVHGQVRHDSERHRVGDQVAHIRDKRSRIVTIVRRVMAHITAVVISSPSGVPSL